MPVKSYEKSLMQFAEYRIQKSLMEYFPPFLVVIGTFGNIFSFVILRRKVMSMQSTYLYLAVLAWADTLVLYVGLLRLWISELSGRDFKNDNDWFCKITSALLYTSSDYSVWLIIAVTVERYIVVCHPFKASVLCKTARAKRALVLILLLTFGINSHFFWTVEVSQIPYDFGNKSESHCGGKQEYDGFFKAWSWVDAIKYSFLPLVIITLLNSMIIRRVILAYRKRNNSHTGSASRSGSNGAGGTGSGGTGSASARRGSISEASTKLTLMLLTVSFSFLLTTLPMIITLLVRRFWRVDRHDQHGMAQFSLARTVVTLLMYTNHSMNFFLYCATGQKFRHQVLLFLCKARKLCPSRNTNDNPPPLRHSFRGRSVNRRIELKIIRAQTNCNALKMQRNAHGVYV